MSKITVQFPIVETFREDKNAERKTVLEYHSTLTGEAGAEQAFQLSNAPDEFLSDTEIGMRIAAGMRRVRSLSVGDFVMVDGETFLCAGCGWEKV